MTRVVGGFSHGSQLPKAKCVNVYLMNQPHVDLTTRIARNGAFVSSYLDNELVMMDAEEGRYFSLNPTTSRIWELLAEPRQVSSLCDQLMTIYNVERERCETQVLKVLGDMQRQGLVLVQDKP
jgi:hypothetical protein